MAAKVTSSMLKMALLYDIIKPLYPKKAKQIGNIPKIFLICLPGEKTPQFATVQKSNPKKTLAMPAMVEESKGPHAGFF